MEEYENLYKKYVNKVIENYEFWFANYVLIDISEMWGFESLIDDNYELEYNLDLSKELSRIIENLLITQDNASIAKENELFIYLKRVLIDFIQLKRIIDKKIIESKVYNEDYVKEFLFDNEMCSMENKRNPIVLNDKLRNKEELVNEFYTFLKGDYIECDKELFEKHFLGNSKEKKINWMGKQTELAAFFQLIYDYEIIPSHKERGEKVKLVQEHFSLKSKDIRTTSIGKEFSIFKNDETLIPEMRNFFKKLQKKIKMK